MAKTVIAGNWKMHGLKADLDVIGAVAAGVSDCPESIEVLLCLPATLVAAGAELASGSKLEIGGQSCHQAGKGAHTGDISAEMLADAGATHVIVGHSERRADHGESDIQAAAQAGAAIAAGLTPIICVGETLEERDSGQALDVVTKQVAGSVPDAAATTPVIVAYEPVWAIGTGRTPTPEQIAEVHAAIRVALAERFPATGSLIPLLYGGSMKPGNAAEILAVDDVNGGLIGGASLKAEDFLAIYAAAANQTS
ncbi:MAG: triose-phosphate isomerase [Hyphomonadaceae bacterium]|nr:triose-phosphate isomerase [Hyphomonadaceae bacterium]